MLNIGGCGGNVGEGVSCRGEDGGGVGIRQNPCLINSIALSGEPCATPLSSFRGGSINELYSGPFLPPSLKFLPLHVAPNIKVTA